MEIEIRDLNDVKIVRFSGSLTTTTSPQAQERLDGMLAQGCGKILLNFENLEFISSAGLRVLLMLAKNLKKTGGSMRVCCLNETVRSVFEISGFTTFIDVFGDESEALCGL